MLCCSGERYRAIMAHLFFFVVFLSDGDIVNASIRPFVNTNEYLYGYI